MTASRLTMCCSQPLCMFTQSVRAKIKRGVDLISDALPFGRLWYPWQSHSLGFCSLGIGSKATFDDY